MKISVYITLGAIIIGNPSFSQEIKANRSLRNQINEYVSDRLFRFPASQSFDRFINLRDTEIIVSVSQKTWLPTRYSLHGIKCVDVDEDSNVQIIPHSKNWGSFDGQKQSARMMTNSRSTGRSSKSITKSLEIEFDHETHGKFEMRITPFDKINTKEEIFKCLNLFFKDDENPEQYVFSNHDNLIHEAHCGHIFGETEILKDIDNQNKCHTCFNFYQSDTYNAFLDLRARSNYESQIRSDYDLVFDGADYERSNRIFQKVINNFPIRLLNFPYECVVLDHPSINALSIGGGRIYLSKGALNAYDDTILELIMAHELGHCELRHSIVKAGEIKRKAASDAFTLALLGVAATAVAAEYGGDYGYYVADGAVSLLTYAYIAGQTLYYEGFDQAKEVEADILMYAYAHKNKIDPKKVEKLFTVLRTNEARKLRGWNKVDGYETHLPTNNRLIQSKNHRIYPLNKDYQLIQKGEIVGNIQAMISGYIEHPYSNNEKFLNFYIIQIKTGENVKVDTELGNVYLGKTGDLKQTDFRNVTTDVLMSYYDTQTFMFVDFSNTKIDQDTVIKRFGKFSVK